MTACPEQSKILLVLAVAEQTSAVTFFLQKRTACLTFAFRYAQNAGGGSSSGLPQEQSQHTIA
jgi:hypothetical protein